MDYNSKVVIIILTLNQKEKTIRCLKSLSKIKYSEKTIFLFDNGSTDGTIELIQKEFPDIITHHSVTNLGVASGRNEAAKIAEQLYNPDYFLFLDNDTTVEKDFLEKLVDPFEQDQSIAITTAKIKCYDDNSLIFAAGGSDIKFWLGTTINRGYLKKDNGQFDRQIDCISSGTCMLVRYKVFKELNGFDNIYGPYAPDDLDFVFRVLAKSYRCKYIPQSIIYHDTQPGRSSFGSKINTDYLFLKTRNWFILLTRHAPLSEKIIFFCFVAPLRFIWMFSQYILKGNFKFISAMLKGFLAFAVNKKVSFGINGNQ